MDELLGLRGPRSSSSVRLETGAEVGRELLAGAGDAGEVAVAQQPFVGRTRRRARLLSLRPVEMPVGAGRAAGVTEGLESLT